MKRYLPLLTIIFFFLFSFQFNTFAKIKVDVDRTYEVSEQGYMKVEERKTVKNNTSNQFIPKGEVINFEILDFRIDDDNTNEVLNSVKDSLVVKVNGQTISSYNISVARDQISVDIPYEDDFRPGSSKNVSVTYTHQGLVFENGALLDAYIHAFSPNFDFETPTTDYFYKTSLKIPTSILNRKDINFIDPTPSNKTQSNGFTILEFDQESLVDHFVWVQIGTRQVYDFEITQKIEPTDEFYTGLTDRYQILLPRNFEGAEIDQEVYFKSITPEPVSVRQDEEGNIVAEFEVASNEQVDLKVTGFAKVIQKEQPDYENVVGNLSNIDSNLMEKYTQPAEFWEVENPQIVTQAAKLKGQKDNVYDISATIYKFIVDSIDYSEVKRFGLNTRQGALKTLQGGAAVCMEYSDLFLTLMRANDIPTRAVFGYGYDPRVESDSQEAHQWVQVFMPGLDNPWVDVDVTWGESGDLLIGGDLNHFYTHVAYENPNKPALVSRYSLNQGQIPLAPEFIIQTVDVNDSEFIGLERAENLIQKYDQEPKSDAEFLMELFFARFEAGYTTLFSTGFNLQNESQLLFIGVFLSVFIAVMLVGKRFAT